MEKNVNDPAAKGSVISHGLVRPVYLFVVSVGTVASMLLSNAIE